MSAPDQDDPRYEVQDDQAKVTLRLLATMLDDAIKDSALTKGQWGFAVFLYKFDGQALFYMANGERVDVATMLRQWLAREGGH